MKKFTIFFRIAWLCVIIMIIKTHQFRSASYIEEFGSSHYVYLLIPTILLLLLLTIITVIRSLESRNEWRDMIDDGDVEVLESLSYRKKIEKEIKDEIE